MLISMPEAGETADKFLVVYESKLDIATLANHWRNIYVIS